MKSVFYGYRSDVIALFWLAGALFLTFALGSYHPLDPSFNAFGTLNEVQNKCGLLGSFLADLLYQFFGLSSWIVVFFALQRSVFVFQKKNLDSHWVQQSFIGLFCLLVSACLLDLHQPFNKTFFQGHIHAGGLLGKNLIEITRPILHFFGQVILLWSFAFISLILITRHSVLDFYKYSKKNLKSFYKALLAITFCFFKPLKRVFFIIKGKKDKKPIFSDFLKERTFPFSEKLLEEEQKSEFKTEGFVISPEKNISSLEKSSSFLSKMFLKKNKQSPETKKQALLSLKETEKTMESKYAEEKTGWQLPTPSLLTSPAPSAFAVSAYESQADAQRLKTKLKQFAISGEVTHIRSGPMITLFEFKPEDHIKIARITQMEDDLMIALKSKSIRIIAPIPGKDVVGIETAHTKRQTVHLRHLMDEPSFWKKDPVLPLVLGRQVDGSFAVKNLSQIPHLMVAGSTGSGKSVFIVSFLLSLLFRHTPDTLRLLLVDPKRVDLSLFSKLPHLLAPPIQSAKKAVQALNWALDEMYKRYRSLSHFQVRDLAGFNEKVKKLNAEEVKIHAETANSLMNKNQENYYFKPLPLICIVLEEFGDLMSSPERNQIESLVVRLAQMARACGIHLILSMQSPRKDVVTGLIKTNIPGRISFKVSSRIDSRIILDEGGAERLLSQGDMLYLGPGQAQPERYHGPFVTEEDALKVVHFWAKQNHENSYQIPLSVEEFKKPQSFRFLELEDQKYEEVFFYVSSLKEISASHLQRKYGFGYPRAAKLIDKLEKQGVIGPARGSKSRQVIHK